MKLFDAHCHLPAVVQEQQVPTQLVPSIGNVLERAAATGVVGMAVCGTSSNDWKTVLDLSQTLENNKGAGSACFQCLEKSDENFPEIGKNNGGRLSLVAAPLPSLRAGLTSCPMIGTHPWFVEGRDGSPSRPDDAARPAVEPYLKEFQTLEKLLMEHPEAGVGETGLDFQERFTNRAEQEECFAAHLDLARELDRPVAVHCVRAWGRLVEILREHPAPRVLLHAFGGPVELIPELTQLNCWFSFCGSVTNPNAKRVRAAAATVPANRLLIETDAPDFPPAGCEYPNEPANLIHIARTVAELRGLPVEELADITFRNSMKFFRLSG